MKYVFRFWGNDNNTAYGVGVINEEQLEDIVREYFERETGRDCSGACYVGRVRYTQKVEYDNFYISHEDGPILTLDDLIKSTKN